MRRLFISTAFLFIGFLKIYAQSPALPTTGTWGTYGEVQNVHIDLLEMKKKKLPAFDLTLRTKPIKKSDLACNYTTEITNKSAKTVSFTVNMHSPAGTASSDAAKVSLKPGEKKEVSFTIGECASSGDKSKEGKFKDCCNCSFEFAFENISVK